MTDTIRITVPGAAGALLLATLPAPLPAVDSPHAFTVNLALTSNYLFRAISQTNNGPAVQGGFDYLYKPLGLYLGLWASNVDGSSGTGYWVSAQDDQAVIVGPASAGADDVPLAAPGFDGATMEIDLKAGWAYTFGRLGVDLGYIGIRYPRTRTPANNTNEYHATFSYDLMGSLTPKLAVNFSDDYFGFKASWYYDLTVTVPLPHEVALVGHVGWLRFNNSPNHGGADGYEDFSLALSRELYQGIVGTLAWVARTDPEVCAPPFQCPNTAVFTLSKTF